MAADQPNTDDKTSWSRQYVAQLISPADGMATAKAINSGKSLEDKENRSIIGLGPDDPPLNAAQLQTKIDQLRTAEKALPHIGSEIDWNAVEQNPQIASNPYVAAVSTAKGIAITRELLPIRPSSVEIITGIPNSESYKNPQDGNSAADFLKILGKAVMSLNDGGAPGRVTTNQPPNPPPQSSPAENTPSVIATVALSVSPRNQPSLH